MHACTDKLLVNNLLTLNSELVTNCLQENTKEIQELRLKMDVTEIELQEVS